MDMEIICKSRGRNWDQMPDFITSYKLSSEYIAQATQEHCARNNIPLIIFEQRFGDPYAQAHKLQKLLLEESK